MSAHVRVRHSGRSLKGVALLMLVLVPTLICAAERISLDDLLQAEYPGEVRFSPDGELLAFERSVPIAKQPTYGYGYVRLVRQRVFVVARGGGAPHEIAGPSDARYSLPHGEVWSPDGRRLLLIAASEEGYGLAYWDAETGKVTRLPGRIDTFAPATAWIGDSLVYAAVADNAVQRMSNAQMLDELETRWRGAWQGRPVEPTVSSANPLFETTTPAPASLMLADLAEGTSVRLSEGNYAPGSIHVSPDATRFAAVRQGKDVPDPISLLGSGQGELLVFDLTPEGAVLSAHFDDLDYSFQGIAWSPSGTRLLVAAKPSDARVSEVRLHEIDIPGGTRREVASGDLSFVDQNVQAVGRVLPIGWIGERPAAIAGSAHSGEVSAPQSTRFDGARVDYGETRNRRFDLYTFGNRQSKNLTEFSKGSVTSFLVPRGKQFAMVIADGGLWRVAGGDAQRQVSPSDAGPFIAFGVVRRMLAVPTRNAYHQSGSSERVALWALDAKGAPTHFVLDLEEGRLRATAAGGELKDIGPGLNASVVAVTEGWTTRLVLEEAGETRTIASFNTQFADRAVARPERFTYSPGDDEPLTGWVLMPPGIDAPQRLPAVVFVYGGIVYGEEPPGWTRPDFAIPIMNGQLLAAQGYAVIYPSLPLGAGADTDLMTKLADQAVAAVDSLASKGVIDPERVGVMGQSFGGFSTTAILAKRSDRFEAGVAMAGAYDWMFAYGLKSMSATLAGDKSGLPAMKLIEVGQIRLGKPFWRDPQPYIHNSPIFSVDEIDAPVLLLQGDLDSSITSLAGAQRMYHALVRAGKAPVLVRYWGEGHVADSEWAIRDQWSRISTWFEAYLKPER